MGTSIPALPRQKSLHHGILAGSQNEMMTRSRSGKCRDPQTGYGSSGAQSPADPPNRPERQRISEHIHIYIYEIQEQNKLNRGNGSGGPSAGALTSQTRLSVLIDNAFCSSALIHAHTNSHTQASRCMHPLCTAHWHVHTICIRCSSLRCTGKYYPDFSACFLVSECL
jgi:hypothetical protein